MIEFLVITAIVAGLIMVIAVPLHMYFRKLTFRQIAADRRFWAIYLSISVLVALISRLG
jgi:hypothetical protein